MIVNYVYINRNNKFDTTIPPELRVLAKEYKKEIQNVEIRIYSYTDIYSLLREYDEELAELFSLIDPDFAACMADIGRIVCLYRFGGVYHDSHFRFESQAAFDKVLNTLTSYDIVFEKHPNKKKAEEFLVRNTNMIAKRANLQFFAEVLARQKLNLVRMAREIETDKNKRHSMWKETTMPFLEELIHANAHCLNQRTGLADILKIVSAQQSSDDENYRVDYYDVSCCVMPFALATFPKFYNDGMKNHWSRLQERKPILRLERVQTGGLGFSRS